MPEKKQFPNCWEIKKCGREAGGKNVTKDGICPAASTEMGHSCWIIAGSLNDGAPFCPNASKGNSCVNCDVFNFYKRNENLNSAKLEELFPIEAEKYKKIMLNTFKFEKKDKKNQ